MVCYLDAGSWENWRPDAARLPRLPCSAGRARLAGRALARHPQAERARTDHEARASTCCAAKGFDAVEFDNVDGYQNRTGFPLTGADQLRYDVCLANQAHRRGLIAVLKNDLGPGARRSLPYFDVALNEQCFQYDECDRLRPFVAPARRCSPSSTSSTWREFCPEAGDLDFNSMKKKLSLRAWRAPCP